MYCRRVPCATRRKAWCCCRSFTARIANLLLYRDMIAGSKRRKTKGDSSVGNGRTKADDGDVIASADEEDEE